MGSSKMKLKILSIFILEPGMMVNAWNPKGPNDDDYEAEATWAT